MTANAQPVVINELHYHPSEIVDPGQTLEFLELHNPGVAAVDLSGWTICDGVTFTFPNGANIAAGGYVVVALNPTALLNASGHSTPYQWTPGVNLSNGGERVALCNNVSALIDEVTYDDASPWPVEPDGNGPTLELLNPSLNNALGTSWRRSVNAVGTPGAVNSGFDSGPSLIAISPARRTAVGALSSVTVTFDRAVNGVTADDLTVNGSPASMLTGTAGTAGPYEFSGFAAPSPGSTAIQLLAGGITDGQNVPFAGDSWTVSVGQHIILNEINYHPHSSIVDEATEFVELHNAGANDVNLGHWSFVDGITFEFPPDTIIAAGAYHVVAYSPADLQSATGYAGASAWSDGRLANSGERLTIVDGEQNVIDQVTYSDKGVWSSLADGSGPSLELINPHLPNQYGSAWLASVANHGTPGAQNSRFNAAPAPIIAGTLHSPAIPPPLADVTITTTVIDDVVANPTVDLHYRQDQNPTIAYTSVSMFDDGLHGDGAAGDNIFGAVVAGLPDGQRLDFYITASDGVTTSTAPHFHQFPDLLGNPQRTFLCKFATPLAFNDFPTFHVIITEANRAAQEVMPRTKTDYDATFIDSAGTIYYNARERFRGSSSLNSNPPSYRVDVDPSTPVPSEMGFDTAKLNFMASARTQALGYGMFESLGIPASHSQFARFIVNPTSRSDINAHVYANVEYQDGDFLERFERFPENRDNGNLYRGRHNGALLEWEGTNPDNYRTALNGTNGYEKQTNETEDNWTDLITLCDALWCSTSDGGAICTENTYNGVYIPTLFNLIDEDNWAKWFALHIVLNNTEGGLYLDTGDDYFIYFTLNPADYNASFIPVDMDSILAGTQHSIWRTTTPSMQRLLRHNSMAPIYVKAIQDILNTEFTVAAMDARIDAIPPQVATNAQKQAMKDFVIARRAAINAEIVSQFTVTGIPSSPYAGVNPVLNLSGTLNQAGTHSILVNGVPATFSVYAGTWSHNLTLRLGLNQIVVQSMGRQGEELGRFEQTLIYRPPPAQIRITAPAAMMNTKSFTLRADMLDFTDQTDWRRWSDTGTVSVTRVADGTPVPITTTVFDTHDGMPTNGAIRFYNGVGSVSFILTNGGGETAGELQVAVTVDGVTGTRNFNLLDNPTLKPVSGTLSGADLTWSPADGVIHLNGDVVVHFTDVLTILPGTLVMVDPGVIDNGTLVNVFGRVVASGTAAEPIFFFPTNGAAALALHETCEQTRSNHDGWRGIYHYGTRTSVYEYCFVTGAGNGPAEGHTRAPILRYSDAHSVTMRHSVICDNNGKALYGTGSGTYDVRHSLISRCGHGAEWTGLGSYTLTMEDCWFTGIGHGPGACDYDGDCTNVRGQVPGNGGPKVIRGCVFADGNDDGIDHNASDFTIESCIVYDFRDKGISMSAGGTLEINNTLMFDTRLWGIRAGGATVRAKNCTIASPQPIQGPACGSTVVDQCILWPNNFSSCCGQVGYSLLGAGSELTCGVGNFTADPLFVDATPPVCDFELLPTSPAKGGGQGGSQIGWLGFPVAPASAQMIPILDRTTSPPGAYVDLRVTLASTDDLRSYSSRIGITRISGSGSVTVECPAGVSVNTDRPDFVFYQQDGVSTSVDCPNLTAGASLTSGSVNVGPQPVYLAGYRLNVSADAAFGSVFEITIASGDGTSLTSSAGQPIAFGLGDAVQLVVAECPVVNAGPDLVVCSGYPVPLAGASANSAACVWSSGGDGIFGNNTQLITTYTPGVADTDYGSVTLTLTCQPIAPCAVPGADTITLTVLNSAGRPKGDVNGDGMRDGDDVMEFVAVLFDPGFAIDAARCAADLNNDGQVEQSVDVILLVDCLLNDVCP